MPSDEENHPNCEANSKVQRQPMRTDHSEIAINSPKLRRALAHWREARGGRAMPRWQDIRPAAIKVALSHAWSYRYDAIRDDFIGALAGGEIQRLLGGPIKGCSFRDVHAEDQHFFARAKKVVFSPAIFVGRGLLFQKRERQCYGERIILPFSDKNGQPAGIFGITDYSYALLYKAEPETRGEIEQWIDPVAFGSPGPARLPESLRGAIDVKLPAP